MNIHNVQSSKRVTLMQSTPMTSRTRRKRHQTKIFEVITILIFLSLLFILGFIIVSGLSSGRGINPALAYARQTQQALKGAVTPTPFQPVADIANPADTPEPGEESSITPTSTIKPLTKPEGQVNILLLASDVRPDDGGFRTDSIIWVSMNPKDGFVSAISFPRDLYVAIPGYGENRINVVFPQGGFELLAETFEQNFGVRPDYYALIDFNGFKALINNLGGINVQTAQNLTDSCAKWINPSGTCSVGPGPVQMDGEVALWYARSRYSSNDIDRGRRAQEVIKAIFNRLMSLDAILRAPELYDTYNNYVVTDIKLSDIIPLLPLANQINNNGDIRNYVVGYDHAYDWITMQGAQVLVPDYGLIRELMVEALALE